MPNPDAMTHVGVVSPRRACNFLGVGVTRLYEMIGSRELESYREGKSRRITLRSIVARQNACLPEWLARLPHPCRASASTTIREVEAT